MTMRREEFEVGKPVSLPGGSLETKIGSKGAASKATVPIVDFNNLAEKGQKFVEHGYVGATTIYWLIDSLSQKRDPDQPAAARVVTWNEQFVETVMRNLTVIASECQIETAYTGQDRLQAQFEIETAKKDLPKSFSEQIPLYQQAKWEGKITSMNRKLKAKNDDLINKYRVLMGLADDDDGRRVADAATSVVNPAIYSLITACYYPLIAGKMNLSEIMTTPNHFAAFRTGCVAHYKAQHMNKKDTGLSFAHASNYAQAVVYFKELFEQNGR